MRFSSLDMTFGKLDHRSLTLSPGLNIIEAPNESGKSTLLAFLRVMLYGIRTSERGALADKNRYAPWSGKTMSGRLDLVTEEGDITLRRDTVRVSSPMGHFSATYTGSGTEVTGLTGTDCGETLLGVPREVYERSAFISQCGLKVESNAELERRIAALITTGEEGASFSETAEKLKGQLNKRRRNKTGYIPALEQEIAQLEGKLAELQRLSAERSEGEEEYARAQEALAACREKLALHDIAERQRAYWALHEARRKMQAANAAAESLARELREGNVPPRETLEESRAKLRTLNDLEKQNTDAARMQNDAARALAEYDSASAVKKSVLAPAMLAAAITCTAAAAITYFLRQNLIGAGGFAALALVLFIVSAVSFSKRSKAKTSAAQQRQTLEKALREADAAVNALETTYRTQKDTILAALPIDSLPAAELYVNDKLAQYAALDTRREEATHARIRFEAMPVVALAGLPALPVDPPAESANTLRTEIDRLQSSSTALQRSIAYTDGRIRDIGERETLEAALAEKRAACEARIREYNALSLAIETLESANTALQNRFSPALGKRAAELFSYLTDGRYQSVLLDRELHAQAEMTGDTAAHEVSLLSQGAADQLYLAVRLAICEQVLPAEKQIPLVLDDALTNFDDTRCARALELLLRESESRQILLFTCQSREGRYLAGRSGVTLLSL